MHADRFFPLQRRIRELERELTAPDISLSERRNIADSLARHKASLAERRGRLALSQPRKLADISLEVFGASCWGEKIKDKPVSIARGVNDKEDCRVGLRPARNDIF
jgi:hypothetical protein